MANEPDITLIGNVGADPELRATPGGKAVTDVRVAVTPRVKQGDEWTDGVTAWFTATFWERDAEAIAGNVRKGNRVIITGGLTFREYELDGRTLTAYEIRDAVLGVVPRVAHRPEVDQFGTPMGADPFAGTSSTDPWS